MLVDTNILVYAINADSPKNKVAQAFLQEHVHELEISHQNIFEALRVLTHVKFSKPMKPKDAQEAVMAIAEECRIIIPNYKTHHLSLEWIKEHELLGNKIFDAYLAATAVSNGVYVIATDNGKDFERFGVTVVNPFS
jgi:predicted nucleic acid-binding protein